MPSCRSCQAPIRWVKTAAGKRMPIDEAPVPRGNLEYVEGTSSVVVVDPDSPASKPRFVSHFATCPSASQHRADR